MAEGPVGQHEPPDVVYGVNEVVASALLEAAPDGMMMVDEQGQILLVNAQIEALFGYGRDELVGRAGRGSAPRQPAGGPSGPSDPVRG